MADLTPVIEYLLDHAPAGEITDGDVLALCVTGQDVTIHYLPPGVLGDPARLVDLIGRPDQTLLLVIADPAHPPLELRHWETTRTRIATKGVWLLDPVITDTHRWWQLPAGQNLITGPGTPLRAVLP